MLQRSLKAALVLENDAQLTAPEGHLWDRLAKTTIPPDAVSLHSPACGGQTRVDVCTLVCDTQASEHRGPLRQAVFFLGSYSSQYDSLGKHSAPTVAGYAGVHSRNHSQYPRLLGAIAFVLLKRGARALMTPASLLVNAWPPHTRSDATAHACRPVTNVLRPELVCAPVLS